MKDYIRNQRARYFESDFLEFFSKVHPAMPPAFWLPIVALVLWRSISTEVTTWTMVAAFVPLGFVTWQLMEYFLHKKLFHWEGNGPLSRRFHQLIHGNHHKYPDDDLRLVMPLPVSIFLATVIAALLYPLGIPAATVPYWLGLVVGYVWYDYLHWATHFKKPSTAWGRRLRAHHMSHHFADHDTNFGISHMWLDRVMGTLRKRAPDDAS